MMPSANGQVMKLGTFIFSINTATYDSLNRADEWRWQTQERLLNVSAEQFTGFGSTTITLEGAIYPLRGATGTSGVYALSNGTVVGVNQIENLRAIANAAAPVSLVDGAGKNYGQFVVLKINEVQTAILDNGQPRKQEFNVHLRSFGPDQVALPNVAGPQIYGPFQATRVVPYVAPNPAVTALLQAGQPRASEAVSNFLAAGAMVKDAVNITQFLAKQDSASGGQLSAPLPQGSPLAPTIANLTAPSDPTKALLYTQKHEDELQAAVAYMQNQQGIQNLVGALAQSPFAVGGY